MKFALIIPTLNAGPWIDELCGAIQGQSIAPDQFIVMDSMSDDETVARLAAIGATIVPVQRADFDHGGTRQAAIDLLDPQIEVAVFLTQDAILASPDAIRTLLTAFDESRTGMAYGRQLPRTGAAPIEAHARLFSYGTRSETVDRAAIPDRGIRASFCSNSFAAYRVSALRTVGGFPRGCIFGEDAVAAIRLLSQGWSKAYVADAQVRHSHPYTHAQEFRRYFDIGVLHASAPEMQSLAAVKTSDEGKRFVKSELQYLARHAPWLIPDAATRTLLKYAAYRLGYNYRRLPERWRTNFSLNRRYWPNGGTPAA